jgi:phytoene dehydrogenase-like protein
MTLGLVCVYVVVDTVLDGPNTNYFVFPDYRTDDLYTELDRGRLPDTGVPFAYVALASRKDPGNAELCPPGHTNFQIMTLAPRGTEYWGVETGPADGGRYRRNATYLSRKQQLTDSLIDAAEQVLGPFRGHIVHCEMATPLSHERYTHSTGGTSYGFLHSPDQTGDHRPDHRTEIDGLWVVGANTVSGHGIAGGVSGGVFCAGKILDRPLIVEMFMGRRLVEPALIPPDPDPFDPLEYCRGATLRTKRAQQVASLRRRRAGAR